MDETIHGRSLDDALQYIDRLIPDQTPLASRRLRSNAEGQQVMDLEGMTGEEVAIEEARVAARKENRRVVTEGLKETRKLLRTPEEPLASRGRLNRAKEQGFDTDTVYYHGTDKTFEEFDANRGRGGRRDTGVFVSSNPEVASTYSDGGSRLADGLEPQVLPLRVRLENPIKVYADSNYWSQLGPDTRVDLPERVINLKMETCLKNLGLIVEAIQELERWELTR